MDYTLLFWTLSHVLSLLVLAVRPIITSSVPSCAFTGSSLCTWYARC
jgi:hypothetical protein